MNNTMEAAQMTTLVERVRFQYHWLSQRTYGGRWFIHTDAGKRVPGSFATRVDAMVAVTRLLSK